MMLGHIFHPANFRKRKFRKRNISQSSIWLLVSVSLFLTCVETGCQKRESADGEFLETQTPMIGASSESAFFRGLDMSALGRDMERYFRPDEALPIRSTEGGAIFVHVHHKRVQTTGLIDETRKTDLSDFLRQTIVDRIDEHPESKFVSIKDSPREYPINQSGADLVARSLVDESIQSFHIQYSTENGIGWIDVVAGSLVEKPELWRASVFVYDIHKPKESDSQMPDNESGSGEIPDSD